MVCAEKSRKVSRAIKSNGYQSVPSVHILTIVTKAFFNTQSTTGTEVPVVLLRLRLGTIITHRASGAHTGFGKPPYSLAKDVGFRSCSTPSK